MPHAPVRSALALVWLLALCVAPAVGRAASDDATMKAVRLHSTGGPEVLRYEDAPKPSPGAGQALVRVFAAGVNPVDWKLASGAFPGVPKSLPFTPGSDVSGVVESVGEGVEAFKRGDEVFAYFDLLGAGGYAEYVAVDASALALKPRTINHAEAAATPLAALTAWQALIGTAKLEPGQTVLIHGAAGGVGHFAVQIAKAKGARVIATASAGNHAFLRELGADEVIDYRAERFEDRAKGVDVVLDAVGGETLDRSYAVLRPGGIVVTIAGRVDPAKVKENGVRGAGILVQPSGEELAQIGALIDAGKVTPHVDERFPLERAADAWREVQTGHATGKRVLVVADR